MVHARHFGYQRVWHPMVVPRNPQIAITQVDRSRVTKFRIGHWLGAFKGMLVVFKGRGKVVRVEQWANP